MKLLKLPSIGSMIFSTWDNLIKNCTKLDHLYEITNILLEITVKKMLNLPLNISRLITLSMPTLIVGYMIFTLSMN